MLLQQKYYSLHLSIILLQLHITLIFYILQPSVGVDIILQSGMEHNGIFRGIIFLKWNNFNSYYISPFALNI